VIDHKDQRYETVGDWQHIGDDVVISVSKMNPDSEFLVAVHEFIEQYLCKAFGVTQQVVDTWDMEHGIDLEANEPGDDPLAPYHAQHLVATQVEKDLCFALGLSWEDHCKVIDSL
jgi:hypothetical protein